MCLYTTQKEPLRAEKPIKAFKVLCHTFSDKFLSPYYNYDYTEYVNNHNIIKDKIPKTTPLGLGYYKENLQGYREVMKGFHLFTEECYAALSLYTSMIIFECEIPVGSYYFISADNSEICTNQFRFIKEICYSKYQRN